MSLALVIDRFTRAGWSVTIAPGREPWAIRVEAWRMDGTDRVSAGSTTPRELLYAVADPSATISDALVEIAVVLGVDVSPTPPAAPRSPASSSTAPRSRR